MKDLKTEVYEFVKFGRDSGKLTKMEILEFTRGLRISNEQMKKLCSKLMSIGIEIIDDTEGYDAKLDLETGEHYWHIINLERLEFELMHCNPLTTREEKVLRYRYGLEDGKKHSYREVQKVFGITEKRVRQIEGKLTRKWGITEMIRHIQSRRRWYYYD